MMPTKMSSTSIGEMLFKSCIILILASYAQSSSEGRHTLFRRHIGGSKEMHQFSEMDSGCSGDFGKKSIRVLKESLCMKPRDTIVPLIPVDEISEFIPNHVLVQRCSGMCNRGLSCSPTNTTVKELPVYLRKAGSGDIVCGNVQIEEHVKCKCGCSVKKEDCNDLQNYFPNECMCQCMNNEEKSMCKQKGWLWNMKKCTCDCPNSSMDCNTGLMWVPKICRCMKITE